MNKNIRFLIILFFISVFLMLGSNIVPFKEGHFPLTSTNLVLMGFITFWVAHRLFYLKKKDYQFRIFGLFFFLFFLFVLIMAIPHLLLLLPHLEHKIFRQGMHLGYLIGHIFLYLSLVVFIRLPLNWVAPRFKNIGSAFFLLLGGVTTILNFLLPSLPEYNHSTGITLFNVNPLVGKLVALNVVLAWVPTGIYFIVKGMRGLEKNLRRRCMLLGIGLLVATIGGPLHDISREAVMFLIADIVVLAGIVILAVGVMYEGEDKKPDNLDQDALKS
ncbi:MAG: hypothetical protein Q7K28_02940 [Candidatus Wildermuthbacteria bacterium]|nr:hypothetical protein [Candidatus Wildermuthbacteria bacterium]